MVAPVQSCCRFGRSPSRAIISTLSTVPKFSPFLCQVRQLHSRDTRHQFCPSQHWIQPRLALPLDRPEGVSFHRSRFCSRDLIGELTRSNPGSEPIVPSAGSGFSPGRSWKVPDHLFLPRRLQSALNQILLRATFYASGATCNSVARAAFHHLF